MKFGKPNPFGERKHHSQHDTHSDQLWKSRRKQGRLIIRNLPFKITEEQLRAHFSPYGEVKDINLLKRPDGKLVGCGFIEYTSKESASNAIAGTSGKPLLKRPIIVDWAVPKDKFGKIQRQEIKKEIKEENVSSDDDKSSPVQNSSVEVKGDPESDNEVEVKSEPSDSADEESNEEGSSNGDAGSVKSEMDSEAEEPPAKKRQLPSDVKDGLTVFLKNVPFSATQEDLEELMKQFGPLTYALICVDKMTEHSKGTAFVKFKKPEAAKACLEATQSMLTLGNNFLEPRPALEKQQLQEQASMKKLASKSKDGRNLYLVKEGVIKAGSVAAKGVSTSDMSKRLDLERWKTQVLRNLSMVVSRTRLAVHNLPPTLNDESLRKIFKKYAPSNARILEARIMRDLRRVDGAGKGVSKCFGFVNFAMHEDALVALRAINNNPDVFSVHQRPIVGFSIENKAILNAKKRRLEMSQRKNPYFERGNKSTPEHSNSKTLMDSDSEHQSQSFAGQEAHFNQTVKLPSRQTLRNQAALHRQSVAQDKKISKYRNKVLQDKRERIKKRKFSQPASTPKSKQKQRNSAEVKEEKAFNSLVKNYRDKLENVVDVKKWYD